MGLSEAMADLQARRHLAGLQGRYPRVGIARDKQHRRVFLPLPHILIQGVFQDIIKGFLLAGIAVFEHPCRRESEARIAQTVTISESG